MNKLISICLATYNGEKYLLEQLDSISNQTYKNFELIIQDDCSTDRTIEIIKKYSEKLTINLEINATNVGYTKNFEHVIKKASGDYIAICDQDDIWDESKLQVLVENISNNSLIYSNSLLIDENAESLNINLSSKLKNNFINSNNSMNFLYDNCVSAHAMLFSTELLKYIFPFPKNIYFDQWIAATAANLNGVKYIDKNLVNYRQHDSNTLGNKDKNKNSLKKKIVTKSDKKTANNSNMLAIIKDFKNLKILSEKEINMLEVLENFHENFENIYYDFKTFKVLYTFKDTVFHITNKSRLLLSLKKAIGMKLYKALPLL